MSPQTVFCPNVECPAKGQQAKGNIKVHSQVEKRYACTECDTTFRTTKGTLFYRLKTAEMLGTDPAMCLAIEDSFYGLISAKSARMKVISMPDPVEYNQPRFGAADLKIRSLREINDMTFDQLQKI